MATPEWPASLPQSPLIEGFSDIPQDSVLRSEMDGFTKQRNRYTAVLSDVSESYLLTPTQYQTFKSFYLDTLGNGSLEFLKKNPETGFDALYQFTSPFEPEFNGVQYRVKITLERLP